MPPLLVLGDINIDILARLETFSGLGGDHLARELEQHCGGVGANFALALVKWGLPVRMLGCVGRDWFGDTALRFLKEAGIDVSFVQRSDQALTGLMFIAISPDGQRTIFGSRGANAHLLEPEGCEECLDGVAALHLTGYGFLSQSVARAAQRLMEGARRRKIRVSFDVGMAPSQQIPQKIVEVARRVDILFVGLDEAGALTGQRETETRLASLQRWGVPETVVKLGEKGCAFLDQSCWCEVSALSVPAVDTTGSGDAFAAAYLRARLQGWSKAEAALLANAAGAAAAAVLGAGEMMPEPRQILRLLDGHRPAADWEPSRRQVLRLLRAEMNPTETAGSLGD